MSIFKRIDRSIESKLSLPVWGFALLIVVLMSIFLFQTDREQIQARIDLESRTIHDSVMVAIQENATHEDFQRIVTTLAANNDIKKLVLIENESGTIVAANKYDDLNQHYSKATHPAEAELIAQQIKDDTNEKKSLMQGSHFYSVTHLSLVSPKVNRVRFYSLLISFDRSELVDQHNAELLKVIVALFICLLALALLSNWVQRRTVVKPMAQLVKDIESQKVSDDIVVSEINRRDQFGVLVNHYNDLNHQRISKEKQLAQTKGYIERLTQNVPVLISYIDKDKHYQFVNDNHESWFNRTKSEFIGQTMEEVLGKEFYHSIESHVDTVLSGHQTTFDSILPITGEERYIKATFTPDFDDNNLVQGFFVCVEDATQQKLSENRLAEYAQELEFQTWALEDQKEKAESATAIKSEFLASMSHEIRTPMNGVMGMLKILQSGSLNDEQQHHVHLAMTSAQSLLTIINDILDFSKVEAGKMELESHEFNLIQLLSDITESMGHKAQSKGLEVVLDVAKIPVKQVVGDSGRVRQIVTNLVGNAIKFTEEGEVIIKAELIHTADGTWQLICDVIDSGIGIAEDRVSHVFSEFTQADASTTRRFGGTGLGLSISKKLCELMEGDIGVKSELGVGSQFTFTVMLAHCEGTQITRPKDIPNIHVLVADGHTSAAQTLSRQLQAWGVKVDTADSRNAIEKLLVTNEYQLVFLSSSDSAFNAQEVCRYLKEKLMEKAPDVILMTPISSHSILNEFIGLNVVFQFVKPTTQRDIINSLVKSGHYHHQHFNKASSHASELHVDQTRQFESIRILLVEDNFINQTVATTMLNKMGIETEVAGDGIEAIERLNNSELPEFDLILMDCQMPNKDGYETTRDIRNGLAGDAATHIPIVAMTANAMVGDREKCLAAGMNDYIAKPIEQHILSEKINYWLTDNSLWEVKGNSEH